jgi:hypothetical protein
MTVPLEELKRGLSLAGKTGLITNREISILGRWR